MFIVLGARAIIIVVPLFPVVPAAMAPSPTAAVPFVMAIISMVSSAVPVVAHR